MLQLLFHSIIISITCILWGIPVKLLIKNKQNHIASLYHSTGEQLASLFFAGLLTLSFLSSWVCLFFPLNFILLVCLTAPLLLYLFIKRKAVADLFRQTLPVSKIPVIEMVFAGICVLIFFVAGSLKSANGDTQIYHVQVIKWFNEYGAVPGIANLSPRFGLGSNWFNLISIFRIPFFTNENYTWLNTTAVLWFFIWLFSKWKYHHSKSAAVKENSVMCHYYFLILIFCLFEWELFRDAASSTNYDFIVTVLTLIATSYLLEKILLPETNLFSSFLFIFICISVIPFKLSGIFILLLLLFYLATQRSIKPWLVSFVATILLVTPLLIKNYIITGYPLYPVSWSPLHPDWQVPATMTDYLRNYIFLSNRFYNANNVDFSQLPELMNKEWIGIWFKGLLLQQKTILLLTASSLLIFMFKSSLSINHKKIKVLFALLFIMAAGWLFTAPSPRFGYGVLLTLAFFPACFYLGPKLITQLHKPFLILIIFISVYYLYKKSQPLFTKPEHFIYPVKLEQPPLKTITINGININLPEIINNGWMRDCFDTDLPCTSNENKYLKPRGTIIKEGFKMEPMPDSIFIRNYIY
jgi:hypothetical protein